MWVVLPLVVFLAAYAPGAISLAAGQTMFAVLVVLLFNLIVPEGWRTGAVRLEAVCVGALAALAASLIMWPKGAAAVLRAEIALHFRAAGKLTRASFDFLFGTGDTAPVESAKLDLRARQRVEEALAAYAGERGEKARAFCDVGVAGADPISIGVADDTLSALRHAGYGVEGCLRRAAGRRNSALGTNRSTNWQAGSTIRARRNRELRALIDDLDMVAGSGNRRAEIAAATAACLDARRTDADFLRWLMGYRGQLSGSATWRTCAG
jgi:hypothetical protein